jgi:hypothetical protein
MRFASLEVKKVCDVLGSPIQKYSIFGPRGVPKKVRVTRNLAFLGEYYGVRLSS